MGPGHQQGNFRNRFAHIHIREIEYTTARKRRNGDNYSRKKRRSAQEQVDKKTQNTESDAHMFSRICAYSCSVQISRLLGITPPCIMGSKMPILMNKW